MKNCSRCGSELSKSGACPVCGETPLLASALSETKPLKRDRLDWDRSLVDQSLPPGTLFAERYRIEGLLGRGGMGTVYRILDLSSGRTAALKILSVKAAAEPGFAERFAREIQLLTRLSYSGIPRILSAGVATSGLPYFVSEFVEGQTLRGFIDRTGSLPAEKTVEIGGSVANALAAAHAHGIIHRDVKPQNILMARDEKVFLIDFGIARAAGPEMKSLTETGMLLGTPQYMAPEQIEYNRVDERSDIYSLGIVLFECLTGQVPFDGDTPFAVAQKHIKDVPPRPRSLKADAPPWLEQVILRCLDKNPSRRPWTAKEVATLLAKPPAGGARKRRMANGDRLEEAPSELFGYSMRLISKGPKKGWTTGVALHFEQLLYKLVEEIPGSPDGSWEYRFVSWPQEEVLRKLIDYESEILGEMKQKSNRGWFRIFWR